MDYYEILAIDKKATQDEIKSAYRTMSKKYHPDTNDAANAAAFFRLIQEAYETLSDPVKRSVYDNPPGKIFSSHTNYNMEDDTDYKKSNPDEDHGASPWFLRVIFAPFIPVISFFSLCIGMIAGFAIIISRLFIGLCLFGLILEISEGSPYDVFYIVAIIIMGFVSFCIPNIIAFLCIGLDFISDKLKKIVFNY